MLNDLLLLGYTQSSPPKGLLHDLHYTPQTTHIISFDSAKPLVEYLLSVPNYTLQEKDGAVVRVNTSLIETELDYSVSILINESSIASSSSNDSIDNLDFNHLLSLLNYRFLHLNPIIIAPASAKQHSKELTIVERNISTRLTRINCWIGFNQDNFGQLDTMINYLNLDFPSDDTVKLFTDLLANDIDYDALLPNITRSNDELLRLLNNWDFNAFQYNVDELLQIGYIILNSYIVGGDYSKEFKSFLFFIRDNYKIGNPFHNFRHAIDVLQATNYFLTSLIDKSDYKITKTGTLSLLLASLGHDIGHPGITNAFLINLNSPLSIKFNKVSILENFHKFQFKKILIPFANQTNLVIDPALIDNSILATDMGNHDYFVGQIANLKSNFDDFKLLSCILIKCADISNVCRFINPSCKWGLSLNEEFKQIGCLESYFKDPKESLLKDDLIKNNFNKPIKDIDVKEGIQLVTNLNKNQLFFINRFASDFFTKIAETIPQLKFLSDHLIENTKYWESIDNQ